MLLFYFHSHCFYMFFNMKLVLSNLFCIFALVSCYVGCGCLDPCARMRCLFSNVKWRLFKYAEREGGCNVISFARDVYAYCSSHTLQCQCYAVSFVQSWDLQFWFICFPLTRWVGAAPEIVRTFRGVGRRRRIILDYQGRGAISLWIWFDILLACNGSTRLILINRWLWRSFLGSNKVLLMEMFRFQSAQWYSQAWEAMEVWPLVEAHRECFQR